LRRFLSLGWCRGQQGQCLAKKVFDPSREGRGIDGGL
jgi:hypothetical protein